MLPVALTIAGSDPSGGAGIQADLKTFHQFGVYGTSILTLLTVQNTVRSSDIQYLSASFVLAQLEAVIEDIPPHAAKTGALGTREIIEAVASKAAEFKFPLVVDPVMIGKQGSLLLSEDARTALKTKLLAHVYLLTPNAHEAIAISGVDFLGPKSLEDAARAIADLGVRNVLVKGGHMGEDATDILYADGRIHRFSSQRINTPHTHGTGCTYSAAITAGLAKGEDLIKAISTAKQYITRAIETNPALGHGQGPVNHMARV